MTKKWVQLFILVLLMTLMTVHVFAKSEYNAHSAVGYVNPVPSAEWRASDVFWISSDEEFVNAISLINDFSGTMVEIHIISNINLSETVALTSHPSRVIQVFGRSMTINNEHGTTFSVDGVTLILNDVTISGTGTGVHVQNGGTLELHNSTIANNAHRGIALTNNSTAIMHSGVIRDNGRDGILIQNSTFTMHDGLIKGNGLAGSTFHGIYARDSAVTINRGTIEGNARHGIQFTGTPGQVAANFNNWIWRRFN